MLRRLAFAALLTLAPTLASAQLAMISPTAPLTDNNNRIANTAWVRTFFGGGLPLASGKIFIGSAGNLATPQTMSGDCTLSASGVITCTQAAGNFTVVGNLSVGGSIVDGNGILMTNIVAPATPAAGTTRVYVDSTSKVLSVKSDAGTVSNTVVSSTAPSNQFATGLSAAGVIAYAQPSFANLSGSWTCAQAPALTGNVTTPAGSCATTIAALAVTNGMLAGSIAAAKLVGTDIATLGTITTGAWNGTKIGLLYGGTNADLSATGGTSQFLKQVSAGAAITVVRPACADLSNAAASCSTDTTSAANISSGILPNARLNFTVRPQGRLTLTTATPVMTSTASGQTTVYYTPYTGNIVPLYDGTNFTPTAFAEVSQATTDATKSPAAVAASKVYDIFCWVDSAINRCTRGPAWTNDTTRGYTLTMVNGILLNTSAITNGPGASRGTWVGTIRSNGSSQVDYTFGASASGGTAAFFGVWNAYNRVLTTTSVVDNGASYTYNSGTTRQARASAGNQVTAVFGAAEDGIQASYTQRVDVAVTGGAAAYFGLGLDATAGFSLPSALFVSPTAAGIVAAASVSGTFAPQLGVHFISANEKADANVSTFNSSSQATLFVSVMN